MKKIIIVLTSTLFLVSCVNPLSNETKDGVYGCWKFLYERQLVNSEYGDKYKPYDSFIKFYDTKWEIHTLQSTQNDTSLSSCTLSVEYDEDNIISLGIISSVSFSGDTLFLDQTADSDQSTHLQKAYLKYDGDVPPEHWLKYDD